jgi:hypothetical protein
VRTLHEEAPRLLHPPYSFMNQSCLFSIPLEFKTKIGL